MTSVQADQSTNVSSIILSSRQEADSALKNSIRKPVFKRDGVSSTPKHVSWADEDIHDHEAQNPSVRTNISSDSIHSHEELATQWQWSPCFDMPAISFSSIMRDTLRLAFTSQVSYKQDIIVERGR